MLLIAISIVVVLCIIVALHFAILPSLDIIKGTLPFRYCKHHITLPDPDISKPMNKKELEIEVGDI